jgi:hypothetical protein
MNQDTLGGRTDLPGCPETARSYRRNRQIQIGIIEDDGRAVSAEFQQHRLSGGPPRNVIARSAAPGEANAIRAWVRHDLIAYHWPRPGNKVDDARRHTCGLKALHQRNRDY